MQQELDEEALGSVDRVSVSTPRLRAERNPIASANGGRANAGHTDAVAGGNWARLRNAREAGHDRAAGEGHVPAELSTFDRSGATRDVAPLQSLFERQAAELEATNQVAAPPAQSLSPETVARSATSTGAAAKSVAQAERIAGAGMRGGAGTLPFLAELEASFGTSLGHIPTYSGASAARAAEALDARAYAYNGAVVLGSEGQDKRTVAEEVTHVLQSQRGGGSAESMTDPGSAVEHEAASIAESVAAGGHVEGVREGLGGSTVARRFGQRDGGAKKPPPGGPGPMPMPGPGGMKQNGPGPMPPGGPGAAGPMPGPGAAGPMPGPGAAGPMPGPGGPSPLTLGADPNIITAHGGDHEGMVTADRAVTFWTQQGYAMPSNLARLLARGDDKRIAEAWSLWSDHLQKGGSALDFEPEGIMEFYDNIYALEGARSELPGTPFPDMALASPREGEGYAQNTSIVTPGKDEYGDYKQGETTLGNVVNGCQVPGNDPLTVLACRGDRPYFPRDNIDKKKKPQ